MTLPHPDLSGNRSTARNRIDYIVLATKGMAMGAADIIPGVSGGTIAFITGIYKELIDSIKAIKPSLFTILIKEGIRTAWSQVNGNFLLMVFGGILISIFSLARLISWLLDHYQMLVWAFFFGLICASALFVGKKITRWSPLVFVMLLTGALIAYYITIASPATTPETLWFTFITGCIAISAMILPGISGSFILLLMGKYAFILNAVKELHVTVLLSFAAGCVIGLVSFANIIGWLFRKHPNATMALLTGFMIGSLNKLWPWKEVLEYRMNSAGSMVPFLERSVLPNTYADLYGNEPMIAAIAVAALIGIIVVFSIERMTIEKQG